MDDKFRALQRESDDLRDNMSMMNQNMKRSEAAVERLTARTKGQADEIEHMKLLNVQLRDIIEMNRKERKAAEERDMLKEAKFRKKIDELEDYIFKQDNRVMDKYFDQAEAKFMANKREAADARGQTGDILMQIDLETRNFNSKKAQILAGLEEGYDDVAGREVPSRPKEEPKRPSTRKERRRTPPKRPGKKASGFDKEYKPAEEKEKRRNEELMRAFGQGDDSKSKQRSGKDSGGSGLPSLPGLGEKERKKSDRSKFSAMDVSAHMSDAMSEYWDDDKKDASKSKNLP